MCILGLVSIDWQLNVKKGYYLAVYDPNSNGLVYDGWECYTKRTLYKTATSSREENQFLTHGQNVMMSPISTGNKPCRNYSLSMEIQPGEANFTTERIDYN